VHVFDLTGHPATRSSAWSSPIEGSMKRAVLHRAAHRLDQFAASGTKLTLGTLRRWLRSAGSLDSYGYLLSNSDH
jgi:hypothetical protein